MRKKAELSYPHHGLIHHFEGVFSDALGRIKIGVLADCASRGGSAIGTLESTVSNPSAFAASAVAERSSARQASAFQTIHLSMVCVVFSLIEPLFLSK